MNAINDFIERQRRELLTEIRVERLTNCRDCTRYERYSTQCNHKCDTGKRIGSVFYRLDKLGDTL